MTKPISGGVMRARFRGLLKKAQALSIVMGNTCDRSNTCCAMAQPMISNFG